MQNVEKKEISSSYLGMVMGNRAGIDLIQLEDYYLDSTHKPEASSSQKPIGEKEGRGTFRSGTVETLASRECRR